MSAPDEKSDTSDEVIEPITLDDEDEWKDIEPDDLGPSYVSLGGTTKFSNIEDFLQDAKKNHGVDLLEIKDRYAEDLETYGMIKLINFVREQVSQDLFQPVISPKSFLEGDRYMKPFIEDDALLYSIDEIFDVARQRAHHQAEGSTDQTASPEDIEDLIKQNEMLREQVVYFRNAVHKQYLENLELKEHVGKKPEHQSRNHEVFGILAKDKDHDSHYFTSYDHHEIHQTMLQDNVRTDAYRDFIYDNKHLFAGKVVLDVGCGTGILSMFCAKAGATKVIAVDNSSILDKAREIVFANGFSDTVQCLRGKIEEVNLPVKNVDIIISEWMGYCLLYEAMLDSVIWARDRYLAPGGLMVPSHAALHLSLFAGDDYLTEKNSFWNCVYGFDMSCMRAKEYDDIVIRTITPEAVASRSETFLELPLHTVRKEDLTVNSINFKLSVDRDIDQLHGFVIHFDMAFAASQEHKIQDSKVTFTTGPFGRETHWQQTLAMIDPSKAGSGTLKSGEQVHGSISLRKSNVNFRELEIDIMWQIGSPTTDIKAPVPRRRQTWLMH
ncbi:MAG: hypothetical protein Q9166_001561 [cf. Caloplaca sp. 2 TL-2023]